MPSPSLSTLERGGDRPPAAAEWLARAAAQALDSGDFATALTRIRRSDGARTN